MDTWLRQLRIGPRLGVAFGLVLLLLAGVCTVGILGSDRIYGELKTLYEDRTVPIEQIGRIDALMLRNRILVTEMLRQPEELPRLDGELQKNIATITATWKDFMTSAMSADEAKAAAAFADVRGRYVRQGLLATRDAVKAGDIEGGHRLYRERIVDLGGQAKLLIDDLIAMQLNEAQASYDNAKSSRNAVRTVALGTGALAALLAVIAGWLATRSIVQPMRAAVAVAETVASGDLRSVIEAQGRDEAAQLMGALQRMNTSLQQIVGQVRDSSESIATGSREIAIGSADLSQRTEEQASNLEETAASMEQLSSTVRQNAATAAEANNLAAQAATAAGDGGAVVGQVVDAMQGIAQASQRIGDIVGVIDGIAFQTNILALNAAVEAARAGEHGKGFAVVATEVRTLAQRSATAAREIKVLIGESVTRVESGTRQADAAGSAMQGIVEQVHKVSGLIAEIANASREQSQGIGQVGEAVQQLDQVTQQNAALVEESTAAAESLQHQAAELSRLVGQFRL